MKINKKVLTEEFIVYKFQVGPDDDEDFVYDLTYDEVNEVIDKFLKEADLKEVLCAVIDNDPETAAEYFETFVPEFYRERGLDYLDEFLNSEELTEEDIKEFIKETDLEWLYKEFDLNDLAEDMFFDEAKEQFDEMKEAEKDPYYDYHSRGLSPKDF